MIYSMSSGGTMDFWNTNLKPHLLLTDSLLLKFNKEAMSHDFYEVYYVSCISSKISRQVQV